MKLILYNNLNKQGLHFREKTEEELRKLLISLEYIYYIVYIRKNIDPRPLPVNICPSLENIL